MDREREQVNDGALATYLHDHLVNAQTMLSLVERRRRRPRTSTAERRYLKKLESELRQERDDIERLARTFGGIDLSKQSLTWLSERLNRMRLKVDCILADDSLRSLIELEAIGIGIEAKQCLWRTLQRFGDEKVGLDLEALIERGRDQATRVEALRDRQAERLASVA